jgi:signal transduction histidine kinase
MLLTTCLLLGAAFICALWRIFFLKNDIRQLGCKLEKIARNDTNARLTTGTFDKDITALAESVNTMLECHRQNLLDKAHAETVLKNAFTNISHDLKTPLTSALGYLQMLESSQAEYLKTETHKEESISPDSLRPESLRPEPPGLDQATKSRYLGIVLERLEMLSVLIDNLFEFARLIEGHTAFNLQMVNVCNILRDTLSASYSELERRKFTVDVSIPDTPILCLCDGDALSRILQNLIKNVYVHGKEIISVRFDGSVIEIANKTGSVNNLNTKNIFERFYTSDTSRSSKNNGLGLAISKELTERMGGHISADIEDDMLVMRVTLPT